MPRILGYRERLYGNFYDAVRILQLDTYNRLFNNQNIGVRMLSNMHLPGQFGGDQTFIVCNVYVRTNLSKPRPQLDDAKHKEVQRLFAEGHEGDAIGTLLRDMQRERSPVTRALEEWAHSSTVRLIVGDKPMLELNAHDLMDGPALGPGRAPVEPLKPDENGKFPTLPWRKHLAIPILVPLRQNFSVQIDAHEATTRALRHVATEAGVLPEPLLWVHVEGLSTRDVA